MASVIVDPEKLRHTANQITQYIQTHKSGMQVINNTVQGLMASSDGEELNLLYHKWQSAKAEDSTSKEMLDMLERYAAFLNSCAET